jgi:hypothetical protein
MLAAMLLGIVLISATDVGAFELTGAWAVSADQCGKVFIRKGRANEIGFTALSDRHGGGFIVEANPYQGQVHHVHDQVEERRRSDAKSDRGMCG